MNRNVQTEENESTLAFATSDFYQLLSLSMQFPSEELAIAMSDGSYLEDGMAILEDLSCSHEEIQFVREAVEQATTAKDHTKLLKEMRCEYTRLFNDPKRPKLAIYESVFHYLPEGNKEKPMLFMSPEAVDAEKCYRDAGIKVETKFGEPPDHMAAELEFMMFLYANKGKALLENHHSEIEMMNHHIQRFIENHLNKWGFQFFDCLEATTTHNHYKLIAKIAKAGLKGVLDLKEATLSK